MGKAKSKKKFGEYQWSANVRRIIPLQNNYCYIQDDKGKTHHLQRYSDASIKLLTSLNVATHGLIAEELKELGWTEILEMINE
jgi:hypothetical protein